MLLQFGLTSQRTAADSPQQLAVATRSADHTANRGSGRTRIDTQASAGGLVAAASASTSTMQDLATTTSTAVLPETTTTVAPTTTTTVLPTTTTTAAPKPTTTTTIEPVTTTTTAPPKPTPVGGGVVGDDVWTKLAACEAGGRNDLGAPYYGYFQFSATTWTNLGGTGLPSDHTYDEQKAMAIKLQARSGWGQWPVCSKKIGAA